MITTNQSGVIIGTDSLWAFGEPVDPNGSFTLKRFTGHRDNIAILWEIKRQGE